MSSLVDAVSGNAAHTENTISKLRQDYQKALASAAESQKEILEMKK
jgi:dihydrodipicolinate reductase